MDDELRRRPPCSDLPSRTNSRRRSPPAAGAAPGLLVPCAPPAATLKHKAAVAAVHISAYRMPISRFDLFNGAAWSPAAGTPARSKAATGALRERALVGAVPSQQIVACVESLRTGLFL